MKSTSFLLIVSFFLIAFTAMGEDLEESPPLANIDIFNTERWISYPDSDSESASDVPELLSGNSASYQNLFSDDVKPQDLVPSDSWYKQYAEKKENDDDDPVTNRFLDN